MADDASSMSDVSNISRFQKSFFPGINIQHSPEKNKTTCHMITSASPKRRTRRLWRRKAAWFLRPLRRADIITTLYRYRSLASLSWASKSCLYCSVSCFHSIPLCFSLCIKIVADNPFVFSQAARRGRFKKKGTKLHIFMDHIFVARHIKLWVLLVLGEKLICWIGECCVNCAILWISCTK